MSSPYRDNAVQALTNPIESRPRTSLVAPRRALVALAVSAMLVAGLLYAAVNSLTTPASGLGWVDRGGFVTITAQTDGVITVPGMRSGDRLAAGDIIGTVTAADGTTTTISAPSDAVVMQFPHPSSSWTVMAGEPLVSLALASEPATLSIILPGIQATGLTAGDITAGASVWATPANGASFKCTVDVVTPYEQQGAAIVAYIPSPTVERFVQLNGSVISASAICDARDLARNLVGDVLPVSVEVDRRSLLSFIFGGAR